MTTRAEHWDSVHAARDAAALTWHQDDPQPSLDLIAARLKPGEAVIDVGGGSSLLVDALLARGLGPVTVLDLSAAALARAQARIGRTADAVTWIVADATAWAPPARYSLWHDRAVFHFLTDDADRAAYLQRLSAALLPGGTLIMSTFAEDGPETCSSLPVQRYGPAALAAMLERHLPGLLRPMEALHHAHVTPRGATQSFQTSVFVRTG